MTTDPMVFLRDALDARQKAAERARDFDYARCGSWEARGPYPADGEADGVSRPRGNLRSEIGKDDIFLEAELPWDLIPHMALNDPAATLRRIAADRKLLGLHDQAHECSSYDWVTRDNNTCMWVDGGDLCSTLRLLAEGYGWTGETVC